MASARRLVEWGAWGALAWFRIEEPRVLALGDDAGLIAYRAKAQRECEEVYSAPISSAYVRRGGEWRLVFHQQTLA